MASERFHGSFGTRVLSIVPCIVRSLPEDWLAESLDDDVFLSFSPLFNTLKEPDCANLLLCCACMSLDHVLQMSLFGGTAPGSPARFLDAYTFTSG